MINRNYSANLISVLTNFKSYNFNQEQAYEYALEAAEINGEITSLFFRNFEIADKINEILKLSNFPQ
jgi:hypothetical protein